MSRETQPSKKKEITITIQTQRKCIFWWHSLRDLKKASLEVLYPNELNVNERMAWKSVQCFAIMILWLRWFKVPGFSEGLKCYTCVSTISWKDCESKLRPFDCQPIADDVCVKEHQLPGGGNNNTIFSKQCGKAEECTNKHCLQSGKQCVYHCCHTDLCNAATTTTNRPKTQETFAMFLLTASIASTVLH